MYLTLMPMMVRKEIEWKSFSKFMEENNPKKEDKINETSKTDAEILEKVKNIKF